MSEPALRQLDRDLPRVDMYSPAFRRRVREAKRREDAAASAIVREREIAIRQANRKRQREEEMAAHRALKRENRRLKVELGKAVKLIGEQAVFAQKMRDRDPLLFDEGIPVERRTPAIDIIKDVATKYGVPVGVIRGPSRCSEAVEARHRAIVLVHQARPDLSLPAMGRIFNRDHTSILYAIRKADASRATVGAAE